MFKNKTTKYFAVFSICFIFWNHLTTNSNAKTDNHHFGIQEPKSNKKDLAYLKFSDSKWPMVFEDGEYSFELKSEIVADLNLIYSGFKKYRILSRYTTRTYKIDGHVLESKAYLNFSHNDYYFVPRVLVDNFGDMVKIKGVSTLVLSKKLVNSYKDALTFMKEHKVKYSEVDDFINFVNGLKESSVLNDNEVRNLFSIYSNNKFHDTKIMDMKILRSNLQELFKYNIRKPSLLDFVMMEDGDKKVPCYKTILIKRDESFVEETLLGYSESKWRLMLVFI